MTNFSHSASGYDKACISNSPSRIVLESVAAALRSRARHLHKLQIRFDYNHDVFKQGQRHSILCTVGFGRDSSLGDHMGTFLPSKRILAPELNTCPGRF